MQHFLIVRYPKRSQIPNKEVSKEPDPTSNHEQVKELRSKAEKLITNEDSESHTNEKDANLPKGTEEERTHLKDPKTTREFVAAKCSPKKVINFEILGKLKPTRRKPASYSRNANDHTSPEGWKSRELEGKNKTTPLSSPEESQFPCRRSALRNLINTRAHPHEVSQR